MTVIRFVISDADGTLLCRSKLIDAPAFSRTVRTLGRHGIPLCIASGRTYPALRTLFAPHADRLLYFPLDGALAIGGGQLLCGFPLSAESIADSLALLSHARIRGVEFCTADRSYLLSTDTALHASEKKRLGEEYTALMTADDFPHEPIYKIIVHTHNGGSTFALPRDTRAVYQSGIVTELVRTDVSKRRAAEVVCESLHIAPEEILALGDSENDRELLTYAGTAVTVYGAPHSIFSLTKHHTQNAAQAILRFLDTDKTRKDG